MQSLDSDMCFVHWKVINSIHFMEASIGAVASITTTITSGHKTYFPFPLFGRLNIASLLLVLGCDFVDEFAGFEEQWKGKGQRYCLDGLGVLDTQGGWALPSSDSETREEPEKKLVLLAHMRGHKIGNQPASAQDPAMQNTRIGDSS
ncbi:hypothetical protein VNO78_25238 [Psophocarpus tetragonolobus]|uniref:Uncharacterized protein n=1 Tax=Psophocarpus tetragonolobus TaxID=3891 RepID=A0AAN9XF98_PSOTE